MAFSSSRGQLKDCKLLQTTLLNLKTKNEMKYNLLAIFLPFFRKENREIVGVYPGLAKKSGILSKSSEMGESRRGSFSIRQF